MARLIVSLSLVPVALLAACGGSALNEDDPVEVADRLFTNIAEGDVDAACEGLHRDVTAGLGFFLGNEAGLDVVPDLRGITDPVAACQSVVSVVATELGERFRAFEPTLLGEPDDIADILVSGVLSARLMRVGDTWEVFSLGATDFKEEE